LSAKKEAENINTHITEVFNRCMMHHKMDAFDKFEEVSSLVKKTNLKHKEAQVDYAVNTVAGISEKSRQMNVQLAITKNIINTEYALEKKDKDATSNKMITVTSVDEDCELLKWAGINFGNYDSYML